MLLGCTDDTFGASNASYDPLHVNLCHYQLHGAFEFTPQEPCALTIWSIFISKSAAPTAIRIIKLHISSLPGSLKIPSLLSISLKAVLTGIAPCCSETSK